jgi:hypothetical protein
MQRADPRTQLRASLHCNTPVDWNLGIQHSVALLCMQLRNADGSTIDSVATRHGSKQKPVSSLPVNKGFHPAEQKQKTVILKCVY